jgi:histidyl-tRNA synthetase
MANVLQPVRGTRDLIGDDAARHFHVVETARRITSLYGFSEWQTPIFEDTRVFSRTLGETSDVVTKEMYTFEDRGGDSITLRPEGTAGVCRALITNGLTQTLPQKVFYVPLRAPAEGPLPPVPPDRRGTAWPGHAAGRR